MVESQLLDAKAAAIPATTQRLRKPWHTNPIGWISTSTRHSREIEVCMG